MRTFRFAVPIFAAGLAAFSVGAPASASTRPSDEPALTSYVRHADGSFDALPNVPGAKTTAPARLNDRGQVAGYYTTTKRGREVFHGYVYTPGERKPFQTIDVAGAQFTIVSDINNAGQVVGSYIDEGVICDPLLCPPGATHAFLWEDGKVTVIDPPRTVNSSVAYAINDNGQIVGVSEDENFVQLGFLRNPDGSFTIFDPPGSAQNKALGINDNGTVVGVRLDDGAVQDDDGYFPPGTLHGYKWSRGAYIDTIDAPDTRATGVTGIDNDGAIVGQVRDDAGRARGYVADGVDFTTYAPFDAPGVRDATVVLDVAENGDMVIPRVGVYDVVDKLVR